MRSVKTVLAVWAFGWLALGERGDARTVSATPSTTVTKTLAPVVQPKFAVASQATVTYTPFKVSDLKDSTGKPISAGTMITLSDGTKRRADEAIALLNQHEQATTAQGSTLRGGLSALGGSLVKLPLASGPTSTAARVSLRPTTGTSSVNLGPVRIGVPRAGATKQPVRYKMAVNTSLLESQHATFTKKYKPVTSVPARPLRTSSTSSGATGATAVRGATAVPSTAVPLPSSGSRAGVSTASSTRTLPATPTKSENPALTAACDPETTKVTDAWSDSWGDSSTFYASMSAEYTLRGTKDAVRLTGKGNVTGKLFGASFSLLDAKGVYKASATTTGTAEVRLTVLGVDVFNQELAAGVSWKGTKSKSVDVGVTIPIATILGVGVKARVGAKGEVGLTYDVKVSPLYVNGTVKPYINASAYAEAILGASVDLGIVSAKLQGGVGGKMTFLDDTFTISGTMWLDTSTACTPTLLGQSTRPRFLYSYSGVNSLTALSGNLYVFFEAEGCAFGLCVGDRWDFDIYDWSGFGPITTTVFQGGS